MRLTSSASQEGIDRDGLLMIVLALISTFLSLGLLWIWRSRQAYQTARKAAIIPVNSSSNALILFGKQLHNNRPDPEYQARLNRVLSLFHHRDSFTHIFLLGGLTGDNTRSEARAAYHYLTEDCPKLQNRLILEENSRNTLENLKQARHHLQQHALPLETILVSNRYHLHRCLLLAKGLGFNAQPVAAEGDWTPTFQYWLKIGLEGFFIHWYHTGAFISRLVNSERMLNKIQ